MGEFNRDKPGERLDFGGICLVFPPDKLPPRKYPLAINVRAYKKLAVVGRNLLTNALYTLAAAVHSLRRVNDSTPNGPPSGYSIINGAATVISLWNSTIGVKNVATGVSGNPVSLVPFRPNASVQPWCYIGDSAPQGQVTLATQYLISGAPVSFVSNGMMKVSYNQGYTGTPTPSAVCWKSGIREPQLAPVVSTQNTSQPFGGVGSLVATTIPWTNYSTANSSFDYGETEGFPNVTPPIDGTAPFIIDCLNATSITITGLSLDGTVVVNGVTNPVLTTQSAARVVSANPGYPGQFIQVAGTGGHPTTASYVMGAFTDALGNVIPAGVAPLFVPNIVDIGLAFSSATKITVPYGAVALQVGLNSIGNTFTQGSPPNSGLITFEGNVITDALPAYTAILGTLTLAYFGDSPNSGPVSAYIWKNPDDPGGSGPTRSTSNANGSTSGNSFIFDATFASGLPGLPGVGTENLPMEWTTLTPESVASGATPVFAAPLITTYPTQTTYANFNFCLTGNLYFPAPGHYTFVLTNHDDLIWGIGGGVTLVSATESGSGEGGGTSISGYGQTITVVGGYPLLPRENYTSGEGGNYAQTTVVVNVPAAGIYPIEVDYDYWFHSGRILLIDASPTPGTGATIIPPLPANVRQDVQYRYVYRSSATGAQSNPSPESAAETIPVNANTITSVWSNDPQIDVVDYYRIDSVTANFTYVATGPNDDLGTVPGTNTPITDSLLDTELGDQLLSYDNFEPFPSIDLPQKGTCSISGGVITWLTGGAIGGSATGFNIRWLAGTEILIGSPTSLAYTFIARPTSNSSVTIPGVPNATNVAYEIPEPILAAQPLPFLWGPTDNVNFAFGVGDPLRPGTLYWCNGSNLDAAADTNQIDVTDPSEPLVNGAIAGGLGVLFSIKRGWLILPNFATATATATGVTGSTWTLQESSITRGLYIPRCVVVTGGGRVYFRVDDGVHISSYGSVSKSITDQDLFPLFQHENAAPPVPITIAGYTVYPPDDTQPQLQRFSYQNGYLYYDYVDTTNVARTLVFDEQAEGWVVDAYTPTATIHAPDEGQSVGDTLVGCSDGTVRLLSSAGTEAATAVLLTPAFDKGDTRATAKFADLYIETTNP
jgi:hypothetical protein